MNQLKITADVFTDTTAHSKRLFSNSLLDYIFIFKTPKNGGGNPNFGPGFPNGNPEKMT